MARIPPPPDLGRIREPTDFMRHASNAIKSTVDTVNGKLEFDKNIDSQTVTVTFPAANADVAVPHSLGRMVSNYLVSKSSANCSVFDGKTESTDKTIYLQSSAPATVTLILH